MGLVWAVGGVLVPAERADLLRKEPAEIEGEAARLEAAEVAFGQWAEATDGGRRPSGLVDPEPVMPAPGAGGAAPGRGHGAGGA
jgi:hypothetical protein